MTSPSRDQSRSASGSAHPQPPLVNCDLCGLPTPIPAHCIAQGSILGLITCTLCVEDTLAARHLETTP